MTKPAMRNSLLVAFTAAAVLAATACHSSPAPSAEAPGTTFTAQAAAGQTLYANHCSKCHGDNGEGDEAPRLVGLAQGALPLDPPPKSKHRKNRFVTVADVASFVVAQMPPKHVGELTTDENLAILAFDLKANGIDLGATPLTLAKAKTLTIPR
jgi:cytochrome c